LSTAEIIPAESQAEPNALARRQPSTMDLLNYALTHEGSVDVIERFMVLHQKDEERKAKQRFDDAMRAAQQEIPAILPNKEVKNGQKTMFKYASYEQLDKVIRPIYLKHGLSVSFNGAEAPAGKVRVLCTVSHCDGHSEPYQIDLAIDPGRVGLSQTDAELAAQSKAKRRILRNIFNIVDDQEDELLTNGWLMAQLEDIAKAPNSKELEAMFRDAYAKLKEEKNWNGIGILVEARDKKRKACQW